MPVQRYPGITLRWYRDQGYGQRAADYVGTDQVQDGAWPIAVWQCADMATADDRWEWLRKTFAINAHTYSDSNSV